MYFHFTRWLQKLIHGWGTGHCDILPAPPLCESIYMHSSVVGDSAHWPPALGWAPLTPPLTLNCGYVGALASVQSLALALSQPDS